MIEQPIEQTPENCPELQAIVLYSAPLFIGANGAWLSSQASLDAVYSGLKACDVRGSGHYRGGLQPLQLSWQSVTIQHGTGQAPPSGQQSCIELLCTAPSQPSAFP